MLLYVKRTTLCTWMLTNPYGHIRVTIVAVNSSGNTIGCAIPESMKPIKTTPVKPVVESFIGNTTWLSIIVFTGMLKKKNLVYLPEKMVLDPNGPYIITIQTNIRCFYIIFSGERPFSCNICGKTSSTKTNHNKHIKIHHARDPLTSEG